MSIPSSDSSFRLARRIETVLAEKKVSWKGEAVVAVLANQ